MLLFSCPEFLDEASAGNSNRLEWEGSCQAGIGKVDDSDVGFLPVFVDGEVVSALRIAVVGPIAKDGADSPSSQAGIYGAGGE